MELELVIISLVLVASVFAPFFILDFSGKSGIAQMKKLFTLELVKNNLKLTEQENWGNTFIGIDREQKKMLFMKFSEVDPRVHIIDLTKIQACEIDSKIASVKTKVKKENILQQLNLKISPIDTRNPEVILNFYDWEGIYGEDFEMARAEKWKTIIKAHMNTIATGRKAA
ncbi:hypothetical protein SB49_10130 [Sediminicola sp. YIK13]|uniref:hypothetical protein n=1 Tax=Sediminicola sp. YIK13 TaxID=1453352 RepID=UPI00071F1C9D|nr:hypothetical protein [Sediminicola sp. YIK13]ALM08121.1 hypothetical protein SB49_10130 [Sediminicola sp. YIK13]